jgi:gag-polypeptide of LTR copia-type
MRLNQDNWKPWTKYMRSLMKDLGYEYVLSTPCYGDSNDDSASSYILQSVSPFYYNQISWMDTAFQMWQYLQYEFGRLKSNKVLSAQSERENFRMKPGEDMQDYFTRATGITNSLRNLGEIVTPLTECQTILSGLSSEYADDKKVLMTMITMEANVGQLFYSLQAAQTRVRAEAATSAALQSLCLSLRGRLPSLSQSSLEL